MTDRGRHSREQRITQTPVLEENPYQSAYSPPSNGVYVMEPPMPEHGGYEPAYSQQARGTQPSDAPSGSYRRPGPGNLQQYGFSNSSASNSSLNLDPINSSSAQQPLISTPRTTTNNIIRVINKDMTDQFRGRAQTQSHARIRWFENRKSQLLGCCLTMAFLGVTIAIYSYRWTGLIAGSVNTIICGSAVVVTYFRKKAWHQHPNPIVHIRAVLGIFLAVCLLLNVLVDFDPGSNDNTNCQRLAGVTEFFFFTSEAWGLVMACDLFFSVRPLICGL